MFSNQEELNFTDEEFKILSVLIHEKIGIVLSDHKKSMVYRRLSKRINELDLSGFSAYIDLLKSDPTETGNLANAITTNLTSFFREHHHFEHLEELVSDHLKKNKRLRIWSAGCSSGCEPYSIAMVLAKIVNKSQHDAKILATDIDTIMLNTGLNGEYDMEIIEKIPSKYKGYVSCNKETGIMSDEVKSFISFKRLNLLSAWPIKKKFDIIFCRNVVIYFDKQTQRVIFNKFADLLNTKGHLYIGHSENLMNVCDKFDSMGKTIYRKIA